MLAWLNRALGVLARMADSSTLVRLAVVTAFVAVSVALTATPFITLFIDLHPSILLLDGVTPCGMDDTIYSDGYTDAGFLRVSVGDDRAAVRAALGEPLVIRFWYRTGIVRFHRTSHGWRFQSDDPAVTPGSFDEVRAAHGEPEREIWNYAVRGPKDTNAHDRCLVFNGGAVAEKHASYYWD